MSINLKKDNCSQDEYLSMKATPVKTSNGALLPTTTLTANYMVIAQLISFDLPVNHLRQ